MFEILDLIPRETLFCGTLLVGLLLCLIVNRAGDGMEGADHPALYGCLWGLVSLVGLVVMVTVMLYLFVSASF